MADRNWVSKKGSGKDVNVKWEKEGQEIEGYYVSMIDGVGQNQNSTIHSFKKEDGEELIFWGSHVLDDQLSKIEFGTYAMVRYLGLQKTKTGNKSYHAFEVFTDESAGPAGGTFDDEEDDLPF